MTDNQRASKCMDAGSRGTGAHLRACSAAAIGGCRFGILVMLLGLLASCGAGDAIPTRDLATPAIETPGPFTPAEQQYLAAITNVLQELFPLPNSPLDRALGEPTRDAAWQRRTHAVLAQLRAQLTAAEAIQAPPRLRAIDTDHFRAGLDHFRKALDYYSQFVDRGGFGDDSQARSEWNSAGGELSIAATLTQGFHTRHP